MISPSNPSQVLLPNPTLLVLDRIEQDLTQFRLLVHVDQEPSCPTCSQVSRSCHSHYRRCLQDLPWQGRAVQLWLTVRRFRCRNPVCPRQIFCERLPSVTQAYSRQTDRVSELVRFVGYLAGGRPGQRLLLRLSLATSDDTVLRRVRQLPAPPAASLPVLHLGVDDWAWKKGHTYGTILVSLDLRRVVELLPDRTSESFVEWLQHHPEVITIARDRCGLYAEGATLGAPQAQQVADRFHLLVNLSSMVERVLEEHSRQLVLPAAEEKRPESAVDTAVSQPVAEALPPHLAQAQLRRRRRLDLYERVIALSQAGLSKNEICRQLRLGRNTVLRWLRRGQFPERQPRHGTPPRVTQFAEYLRQRWNEGCQNAMRLHREIRGQGYDGSYGMVAWLVADWRKTKSVQPNLPERIAPKQAALLVTRPAEQLTEEQQQQLLDRLALSCPEILPLRQVALEFRTALQADNSQLLRQWIEKAQRCEFGSLVRFAYGLKKDLAAVAAAVDTDWSNGQTEGQINRLKTIKRQMYGRAGFALLRARVLPYCPAFSTPGSSL